MARRSMKIFENQVPLKIWVSITMVSLDLYKFKVSFYIKSTNFGTKKSKIRALPSNLAPNENIRSANVPFCPADILNSNDK